MRDNTIRLLDAYPERGGYRPGEQATVRAELLNRSSQPFRGMLRVRLLTALEVEVARAERELDLAPRTRTTVPVQIPLPDADRRGYGVEVEITHPQQGTLAARATALDVVSNWALAPRYGFLADFGPDEPGAESEARLAALGRYHLNALQFYDWMYRHHSFLPPTREFTDPLGRRLSLDTVQRKIGLARRMGMQALAYVAIYGAAPDYYRAHPEQMLYRLDGTPYTLSDPIYGDWLYIPDIAHPDWRAQLFSECRRAMAEMGFDGIHLDQYGFVRTGYTSGGARVDVERELPGFLSAARAAVGGAPAAFNAVNVWPLAAVAESTVEPLYAEVWPPHDTFRDLREIILRARELRGGRAPVLAAYLSDLQSDQPATLRRTFHSLRRLTAAIYLHGGSHIALGEGNGVLRHAYFPNYYPLLPAEVRAVRADYDFIARYAEYLFDPDWRDVSATLTGGLNDDLRLEAPRFGPHAEPDSLWTIARTRGDALTLGLVNLLGLRSSAWNAPQPAPRRVRNLRLRLQLERPVASAHYASPDLAEGRALPLPIMREGRLAWITLPELRYWGLVIVRFAEGS